MALRTYYYLALLLAVVVVGFIHYRRLSVPYQWLVILVTITFVSESISEILKHVWKNGNYTYHFLIPTDLVIYTIIYIRLIGPGPALRRFMQVFRILGLCFCAFNETRFPLSSFPSETIVVTSVMIAVYALILFYEMLKHPVFDPLYQQALFWFNLGSLVFYVSNFFILGLLFVSSEKEVPDWEYQVLYITNLFLYGCFLLSIIIKGKTVKE